MNKAYVYTIMEFIIATLREKGYEPYTQLKAYLDTNDPSYITRHNNARNIIVRLEKKYICEYIEEKEYESIKKESEK